MNQQPIVVVGDGWAALGTVGFLVSSGFEVKWITGSGARILPSLLSLETGPGVSAWARLSALLGVEIGEVQQGTWIKEYRNKAFRDPLWIKGPTPEDRLSIQEEVLWSAEKNMVGIFEARFELSLAEIEDEFRKSLNSKKFPHLTRIEGIPLAKFTKSQSGKCLSGILLASGEWIECSRLFYADQWSLLSSIEGSPKPLTLLNQREPVGALQAVFHHTSPLANPLGDRIFNSFFIPLPRNPGEKVERHIWGHFSSHGKTSIWTICLSPEEIENNHEVAKKLRRLKSSLDKVFEGSDLIPEGKKSFADTVQEEQVRLVEDLIFSAGKAPNHSIELPDLQGVNFLTDGYGPSSAFHQVDIALGNLNAQTENMDFLNSQAQQA